jgi:hypothetical protein
MTYINLAPVYSERKSWSREVLSTHAEKETRYIQYGPLLLFQ